jgi:hypothetical protein
MATHPVNEFDLIPAILRGDSECVDALAGVDPRVFLNEAKRHGMLPAVADRIATWPVAGPLLAELQVEASGFVAADLLRERELRRALDALAVRSVRAVVFKGAALAYTHYARPDLRPRDDSDLLVLPEVRETAHHTLVGLGYRPPRHVTGELVSYQAIYEKSLDGVAVHTIDLHWRVANPQLFADVLSFDEIDAASHAIPALGPSARGPSSPHALFLACVHRVAHHRDEKLLMWIYDIHLIASRLTIAEWMSFLDLAHRRKVMAICRQGLSLAAEQFGTVVPSEVMVDVRVSAADDRPEPSAAFLSRDRAQFATFVSDLRALPSWIDRGRLLREHLCPSSAYMRQVYAPSSRAPLPALYIWRAVRGAWRWLARA